MFRFMEHCGKFSIVGAKHWFVFGAKYKMTCAETRIGMNLRRLYYVSFQWSKWSHANTNTHTKSSKYIQNSSPAQVNSWPSFKKEHHCLVTMNIFHKLVHNSKWVNIHPSRRCGNGGTRKPKEGGWPAWLLLTPEIIVQRASSSSLALVPVASH